MMRGVLVFLAAAFQLTDNAAVASDEALSFDDLANELEEAQFGTRSATSDTVVAPTRSDVQEEALLEVAEDELAAEDEDPALAVLAALDADGDQQLSLAELRSAGPEELAAAIEGLERMAAEAEEALLEEDRKGSDDDTKGFGLVVGRATLHSRPKASARSRGNAYGNQKVKQYKQMLEKKMANILKKQKNGEEQHGESFEVTIWRIENSRDVLNDREVGATSGHPEVGCWPDEDCSKWR